MLSRSLAASVLVLVAVGMSPSVAVAGKQPAPLITDLTVTRSLDVFAGVLPHFGESFTSPNVIHITGTMTDNNGHADADSTTNVLLQPTSLSISGSGVANLAVQSSAGSPFANLDVHVAFTLTAPMAFTFKGNVASTDTTVPGDETAGCVLSGPRGLSIGFGKLDQFLPWTLSGDFKGVLPPGRYTFDAVLRARTVSPPDSHSVSFSNLALDITPIAPLKSFTYVGLCTAAVGTTPSAATEGSATVTLTSKSTFTAKIALGPDKFSIAGKLDGAGQFLGKDGGNTMLLKRRGRPNLVLSLRAGPALDVVQGTLIDSSTIATSAFDARLVAYTTTKGAKTPFLAPPASLIGNYTIAFLPVQPVGQTLTPSITIDKYPQGTGWATLTVDKKGGAKFKGVLADGTPFGGTGLIDETGRMPLYASLYGGTGSISTKVVFPSSGHALGVDGLVRWFNPGSAKAAAYPAGWPTGIVASLVGSTHFPPLGSGAISVTLTGGGLATSPAVTSATINPAGGKLSIGTPNPLGLSVTLVAKTGAMSGSFVHDATNKKTKFSGVIVQSEQKVFGFFLNARQSGDVLIQ